MDGRGWCFGKERSPFDLGGLMCRRPKLQLQAEFYLVRDGEDADPSHLIVAGYLRPRLVTGPKRFPGR